MATRTINQPAADDVRRQYDLGSDVISIGGKTYKRTSPVVQRALTQPATVAGLTSTRVSETPIRTLGTTPSTPSPISTGGTPSSTGTGQAINVSPETTPSQFKMALQNIIRNKYAGQGNEALTAAGKQTAAGLLTLPEELSSLEGFGGLNLSQARRASALEEGGLTGLLGGISGALEQRQSRISELAQTAADAFAESRAAEAEAEGLNKEQIGLEQSLRKEFVDSAKQFETIRDSYGRIIASADEPSAAGDLSLIFNYMKMLDPGSVVRESEFANAAAAGSYGERIQGFVNQVLTGQRLSDNVRADFVDRANSLYDATSGQHSQRVSEYTRLAQNAGLDPNNIVIDLGLAGAQTATTSGGTGTTVVHDKEGNAYEVDSTNPEAIAELTRLRSSGDIID